MSIAYDIFRASLGMAVLLGVCYAFSADRRAINWKLVAIGVGLQVVLAILILKVRGVSTLFDYVARGFRATLNFTAAGAEFLFGGLVVDLDSYGYIFAFQVLPTIVFFSALSAILYYLGILQKIVYGLAWLLSRTMGLTGAESLAAAANVFIGQTEAPLVIKPYLEEMTRSELLCVMVGGMATIAGSVFVSYIGFLGAGDEAAEQFFARHLLAASIISAPAAIVCAKMLLPEERGVPGPESEQNRRLSMADSEHRNLLDAIAQGTYDGLRLAVNVGAMLLVFTALIFMLNVLFVGATELINEGFVALGLTDTDWNAAIATSTGGRFEGFSFTYLLALLFAPVAWIIGVPFEDITLVGQLLGLKTVINEFVAYDAFRVVQASETVTLQPKSILIAAYALCGFANFASIGIQVGGISAIAPGQRDNLTDLGIVALVGGTVACLMTGTVAGVFY